MKEYATNDLGSVFRKAKQILKFEPAGKILAETATFENSDAGAYLIANDLHERAVACDHDMEMTKHGVTDADVCFYIERAERLLLIENEGKKQLWAICDMAERKPGFETCIDDNISRDEAVSIMEGFETYGNSVKPNSVQRAPTATRF